MIVRKTPAELEKMRASGLLVWQILQKLKEMLAEVVSTMDLEVAAEKMIGHGLHAAGQVQVVEPRPQPRDLAAQVRHVATSMAGQRPST